MISVVESIFAMELLKIAQKVGGVFYT